MKDIVKEASNRSLGILIVLSIIIIVIALLNNAFIIGWGLSIITGYLSSELHERKKARRKERKKVHVERTKKESLNKLNKKLFKPCVIKSTNGTNCTIYHNLPDLPGLDVNAAVCSWARQTKDPSLRAFKEFVEHTGKYKILTEEEYNSLPD